MAFGTSMIRPSSAGGRLMAGLLACGLFASAEMAAADALKLVVAFPAGGPADVVARQLAPALQAAHAAADGPVRVDNIPGAGGGLGVQQLLAGPADGSRWLVGTPSETIVTPLVNPALRYRPEQLRLIGLASVVPVVLVGSPQGPHERLTELLNAARARPSGAPLSFGSYGHASHAHLAAEAFAAGVGLETLHVPHTGVAPLLREMVAGRIDLAFVPLAASVREFIDQGRLRLHAFAQARRDPRYPDTPTIDEAAGTSGFRQALWVGVFLPSSVPEATRRRAHAALLIALEDETYRRLKQAEGNSPGTPLREAGAQRFYEEETARYRQTLSAMPVQR